MTSAFISTGSESSVILPIFPLSITIGHGSTKRCPKHPLGSRHGPLCPHCVAGIQLLLGNQNLPPQHRVSQFSCSVVSDSLWPHGLQHTRFPCPSPTPGAYSNSCLLSRWCHATILSSVVPFSSCLQSFPASGSFLMSRIFGSASASVLPMNIQDWFPLEWTGWISLQSKGLSRVFSNTTVQTHQFFSAQLSI